MLNNKSKNSLSTISSILLTTACMSLMGCKFFSRFGFRNNNPIEAEAKPEEKEVSGSTLAENTSASNESSCSSCDKNDDVHTDDNAKADVIDDSHHDVLQDNKTNDNKDKDHTENNAEDSTPDNNDHDKSTAQGDDINHAAEDNIEDSAAEDNIEDNADIT